MDKKISQLTFDDVVTYAEPKSDSYGQRMVYQVWKPLEEDENVETVIVDSGYIEAPDYSFYGENTDSFALSEVVAKGTLDKFMATNFNAVPVTITKNGQIRRKRG